MESEEQKPELVLFELSLHQCREQYASFMHLQTRAHQIFGSSSVIMGVLFTFLISAQVGPRIPLVSLIVACLLFFGISCIYIRITKARGWRSGPDVKRVAPNCFREGERKLFEYTDHSYKKNIIVQRRNGRLLNTEIYLFLGMILNIIVTAFYVVR